ncbi:MAG: hypothetical protein ACD_46C00168G0002 [uncultured bacterium]|nr:MAG: hypothetical protein ACD_46C00168G0002 [uncultured bacterium]
MYKLQNYLSEKKWLLIYTLTSIALLYLIFSPAVNFLYYAGDDFRYTFGNPDLSCRRDDGFYFMMTLGRPLQAYMDCISFRYAYVVENMRYVRLIAVLLMGISVGLIADWLRSFKISSIQAFLIAIALILIPHFYSDTILTGALSLPVPILLVVIAYRCIQKTYLLRDSIAKWTAVKKYGLYFLAFVLLILALLSYPAMVFFYATLMLTKILFAGLDNWEKTRREIIIEGFIFFCACAVFFAWSSHNMHYHAHAPIPPQYMLMHPNFNPIEMFKRLTLLGNIFNPAVWALWPMSPVVNLSKWMSLILAVGLMVGLITALSKLRHRILTIVQVLIFALCALLISNAFPLLIPKLDLGSRLLMGTISSGIIITIWALYRSCRILPSVLGSALVTIVLMYYLIVQSYQTNLYLMRSSMAFVGYLNHSVQTISDYTTNHPSLKRIHYVINKDEVPFTRYFLTSGALSILKGHNQYQTEWCASSHDGSKSEVENQNVTLNCLKSLPPNVIGITYSYLGDTFPKTDSMLVIKYRFDDFDVNKVISQ